MRTAIGNGLTRANERAKRKKKLAITMAVMCAVAVVGMFFLESDLTFDFSSRTLYNVCNIGKGFDEDGQICAILRELACGASQRSAV